MYPAAGMLVMALEAAKQLYNQRQPITGYVLSDTTFTRGLIIPPDAKGVECEFTMRPMKGKGVSYEFTLLAYLNERWAEICHGFVEVEVEEPSNEIDEGKEALALATEHDRLFELAQHNCREEISMERFYSYFSGQGLDYGPAFRGVQHVRYDDDAVAFANVEVFKWSPAGSNGNPPSHIIHPATLDTILQTAIVPISHGTKKGLPAILPTRTGRLWIKETGISFPQDILTNVRAHAVMAGPRKAMSNYLVADVRTGQTLLKIENSEGTLIDSADAKRNFVENQSLCYDWSWKADLDLLDKKELFGYCESARSSRAEDKDYYQGLSFVMLSYMSEALESLSRERIEKPTSHLGKYIEWMQNWVGYFHDGRLPHLSPEHPSWKRLGTDEAYRRDLYSRLESTGQGRFFLATGRNLLPILKGEVDPLTLYFQEDELAAGFYRAVSEEIIDYGPLFRYVDLLRHKNPSLKILEVGAGTGALTNHILKALTAQDEDPPNTLMCSQYDFTDVSGGFMPAASEKFAQFGEKIKYFALDIERDPSQQGAADGAYDLIIAGSVRYMHPLFTSKLTSR